jgi:hypothetical protein
LLRLGHSDLRAAAESGARPDLKDELLMISELRAKLETLLVDFVARVAEITRIDDAISD